MNLIALSGPRNCVNTQYAALSGAMKGASPFSSMGEITVDPKGLAKLLDGLNVH